MGKILDNKEKVRLERLETSVRWLKEDLRDLESILEDDIPIQDNSDFKNEEEVNAAIKNVERLLSEAKEEIALLAKNPSPK